MRPLLVAALALGALAAMSAGGPRALAEEPRSPARELAYSRDGRVYGCASYFAPVEKTEGEVRLDVREVRSAFRLLTLGAEEDLDAVQYYFSKPGSPRILGFAIKQKTGQVEQYTEGALTPNGLQCRVIRNGEVLLEKTFPVPAETVIPYDMSFIPKMAKASGGKGGTAVIVSVETLALVEMEVRRAGEEEISVDGRRRKAARYNVVSGAKGTPQPLRMRQSLYFDPGTDELLLAVEDDPSRGERTRVELAGGGIENRLVRLRQRGDELKPRPLPWRPGSGATYVVQRDGVDAGTVTVRIEASKQGRMELVSSRRLGADVEDARAVLTPEGQPVEYSLDGKAQVAAATGEPEERAYSLRALFGPDRISSVFTAGDARRETPRVLDGKVYLLDRNAPELFAVIASQLDLKLGKSANVGVYHARDGEAEMLNLVVTSSGEGATGPYYVVHVRGRGYFGTLTVAADGHLLRADRQVGGGVATLEYILKE